MSAPPPPPATLRICSFESRRAADMESLLRRHGASPTIAPSMGEALLEDNPAAFQFADALRAGQIDVVIFLTGVGTRALLETLSARHSADDIVSSLADCEVVIRGPKPLAVLREWGIRIDHRAPEPNTWREVISALEDASTAFAGRCFAVQEYGQPAHELHDALAHRGARVWSVPIYRWKLPEDTGPLKDAVHATIAGDFDVLMFTSARQIVHVLEIADRLNLQSDWRTAANRCVIASIGPTASQALRNAGLDPDLEPSHPKMGHLVRESCQRAREILLAKHQ